MNTNNNKLPQPSDWTFDLLELYDAKISELAKGFGLDTFPIQIEIITAEQMMDAYTNVGMPLGYNHWSFGKQFVSTEKMYRKGMMGLAYEIVINSNPCIAYLLEENNLVMQAIVIAHAAYGHNSFFKGNYMFKTWTNPDSIIDYMLFAKNYIKECEEHYGVTAVEELLDSCHALMSHGVDRYKRPQKITLQEEKARQREREAYLQSQINDLWRTIPTNVDKSNLQGPEAARRFPLEPEENLLYFLEKNAPLLKPWQREIIRIVRKISQYYYPQKQTKVMNEGWATFWHYTLINALYDTGQVNDEFMLEFIQNHTSVIKQLPFDHQNYSGINPYTLGFNIFSDLRRMCENPTEEDKLYFPDIAGSSWKETLQFSMMNFRDESFISQYLSPTVIRNMKLFSLLDDDAKENLEITAIHDTTGYNHIRKTLSDLYNLGNQEPNIQVYNVDIDGDRSILLRHTQHNRIPLADNAEEVLKHFHRLWGFDVILESLTIDGVVQKTIRCSSKETAPVFVSTSL